MRTKKSLLNFITSFGSQFIIVLLGFISRRVLIYSVGVEYLGINGLMTNILTIFSLAESGIGLAIGYSLYEPLATQNIEKIKSLMHFYKMTYRFLAISTAIIGIVFYPFLPYFIKDCTVSNVTLIYFLYLFSSVSSYLYSYKVTINNSDQNKYLYTIANTITQILVLIIKVIVLYYTENYILFLAIDIFTTLIKNIIFSKMVDRSYPYLKDKNIQPLDKKTSKSLFKNIKALFISKIGYIISQCSDNLVISSIVGISSLGIYDNYNTIISSISSFVTIFTSSITASMGNLIATENKNKSFNIFEKIFFINNNFYTFCSVCLFCLMEPFIEIWLGKEYILNKGILFVAVLLFFVKGISLSADMVKSASGLFHPDRYITSIEATVNLIISIALAKYYGLIGVLIGTIVSFALFSFWIKPYLVFKNVFDKPFVIYLKSILKCFISFFVNLMITDLLISLINGNMNIYLLFMIKLLLTVFISLLIIFVGSYKNKSFKEIVFIIIDKIRTIF